MREAYGDLQDILLELKCRWDHERESRGKLDSDVGALAVRMEQALPLLDALWAGDDERLMAYALFDCADAPVQRLAQEVYQHAVALADRLQHGLDRGGRDARELEHACLVLETVLDHLTPFISREEHGARLAAAFDWLSRVPSSRTADRRSET